MESLAGGCSGVVGSGGLPCLHTNISLSSVEASRYTQTVHRVERERLISHIRDIDVTESEYHSVTVSHHNIAKLRTDERGRSSTETLSRSGSDLAESD